MKKQDRQARINELEHRANLLELEHAAKKLAKAKPALVARAAEAAKEAATCRLEIRRLVWPAMSADVEQCEWKEDEDGNWWTQCDQLMVFQYAKPFEQGYNFCHHCGKPIKFVEYTAPKMEDET